MRNGVIASLLVVAIVASTGTGYFMGNSIRGTTITVSTTSTILTTSTMPSSVCITAPSGTLLYVKVTLDDKRTPVTNATVDAQLWETCYSSEWGNEDVQITILVQGIKPNASGVAKLDAGFLSYLLVTVHYSGQSYRFEADVHNATPARPTCASLGVPSGSLSVSLC